MDFRFSEEDEAFRAEVHEFLQEEWGDRRFDPESDDSWDEAVEFERKLGRKAWLTMAWPKAYGGGGANQIRQLIFREELSYFRAPVIDGQGVNMVGPCLMVHGTEEQKQRFLPPISRCEVVWAQGFSEPNAGSDLASLTTRAVRDGDDYVVNGQKIWTTAAHRGQWIHTLVRTDPEAPKHRGISYLLVDMKSPGVTVRPIVNMAGRSGFSEVFFENVRVPRANMLGEENRGWYVAMTTLDFERSSIGFAAEARHSLEDIVNYARTTRRQGRRVIDERRNAWRLADMSIEIDVAKLLSYRVAWMQSAGLIPNYEASVAKTFSTELQQRLANTAIHVLGPYGLLAGEGAPLDGTAAYNYLWTVGVTIYAGSNEIQRNIIAQRGLGLPRD